MEREDERRRYPRLSTGPEYRVHYELRRGAGMVQAQLQNVSACGCGLQVQMAEMGSIDPGTSIQALYLDHPDLPYVPLECSVVRVLGKVPGKSVGYALVGLDFSPITPFMAQLIQDHVISRLG